MKKTFVLVSVFLIAVAALINTGCRDESDAARSMRNPTKVAFYFASPYSYMASYTTSSGSHSSESGTLSSVTQTIEKNSWAKSAFEAIIELAGVDLIPIAVRGWKISDLPNRVYDVLLDEDGLRSRLPGVLPSNPYNSDPPKCDLVYFDHDAGDYTGYLEAGYFQPVEQLLKSHAPNLWSSYPTLYWESRRIYGEILGIPASGVEPNNLMPPYWIVRADLLSQNGIPIPRSFSELVDVAVTMKTEDLCDVPFVFNTSRLGGILNRFSIFRYMLDINGYRSLSSDFIYYDSETGTVSSIFDGPIEILSEAIDIVLKMREHGINPFNADSRSSYQDSPTSFGYIATTKSWLALYVDNSEPADDMYRILEFLSEHHPEVEYTVLYFEPTGRRYFKHLTSPFRNAYFIPAHTDKAVEIIRLFEAMNTRRGYDALHSAEGIQGDTIGEILLYTPTPGATLGSEEADRYPAMKAISSNPLHIPVYRDLFAGALERYYERYESHDLVNYDWDDPVIHTMDISDIYSSVYKLTQPIRSRMDRFFYGESIDYSWFEELEEIEHELTALKDEFQRRFDRAHGL